MTTNSTKNLENSAVTVFENLEGTFTVAIFQADNGNLLAFDEFLSKIDAAKVAALFISVCTAQDENFKTDAPSTIQDLLATFAKDENAKI
jgi:hypothetical protein